MLKYLINKWQAYSNLGVQPTQTLAEQKRIILINQVAFIAFFSIFIMNLGEPSAAYLSNWLILLNFASIFSIWSVPYMNYKGLYSSTSLTLSVLTPFFTVLFSTLSRQYATENDISHYFAVRFLLIGELILPLILIDIKKKFTFLSVLLFYIICIIFYDKIQELFGFGVFQVENIVYNDYRLLPYFLLFPMVLLIFGVYFLLNLNSKYETKIFELVDEVTGKNEVLENQKEEIIAQLEENQKQKDIIEEAYQTIENKNRNITDSILYAQRIQQAVLKSENLTNQFYSEYFTFLKPRDIVSGDFYYFKEIDNKIFIAAADCTGHGVPGAFMSILGITLLNEIVRTTHLASEVLNKLRNEIKNSLNQTGTKGEQQDGMDIAFCIIDTETLQVSYAGAHNPMLIFRNSELIELLADRQPVGVFLKEKPFAEHTFQLKKGDVFYLFTDGYYSQFGGERNEKFKTKPFKKLLSEIHTLPMQNQQTILDQTFAQWKGSCDQTDDVFVMGIRI